MATMFMPALEGALERIKDCEKINFIRSAKNDKNKYFLIAGVSGGANIELTSPQRAFSYPFEPVLSFKAHLGDSYFKNFVLLNDHNALNWRNLEQIHMLKDQSTGIATVTAEFKDGSVEELFKVRSKKMAIMQQQIYKTMKQVQALASIENAKRQHEDPQM